MTKYTEILFLGIIICLISVLLKSAKAEYGMFVSLVGTVIIAISAMSEFSEIKAFVLQLQQSSGIPVRYINIIFKVLGVCILGDVSVSICRDQNHSGIAQGLDMFCKCSIIVLSLPILSDVLDMIGDVLK